MGEEIQFPQHVNTIFYPFYHINHRLQSDNSNPYNVRHVHAADAYGQFSDKSEQGFDHYFAQLRQNV